VGGVAASRFGDGIRGQATPQKLELELLQNELNHADEFDVGVATHAVAPTGPARPL